MAKWTGCCRCRARNRKPSSSTCSETGQARSEWWSLVVLHFRSSCPQRFHSLRTLDLLCGAAVPEHAGEHSVLRGQRGGKSRWRSQNRPFWRYSWTGELERIWHSMTGWLVFWKILLFSQLIDRNRDHDQLDRLSSKFLASAAVQTFAETCEQVKAIDERSCTTWIESRMRILPLQLQIKKQQPLQGQINSPGSSSLFLGGSRSSPMCWP